MASASYRSPTLGTVTPDPSPPHPGAMDPPEVLKVAPDRLSSTVRLSGAEAGSCDGRPKAPLTSSVEANESDTLASTKIITFIRMSRYGTTLSSPASSPAEGSVG